ncbi:MAG: hypothetical protein Q8Q05_00510 [bacterium]|nr:hypothetical protein [bacterium]
MEKVIPNSDTFLRFLGLIKALAEITPQGKHTKLSYDDHLKGRYLLSYARDAFGKLEDEGVIKRIYPRNPIVRFFSATTFTFDLLPQFYVYLQRVTASRSSGVSHSPAIGSELPNKEGLPWEYTAEAVLTINNTSIHFEKNEFRGRVLELLTRTDENRNKDWSWDEIYTEIQGSEPSDPKKDWKKVYWACEGINERIAAKSGTVEFLDYTKGTARINQKYLT